jgi:hypothetical protein
MKTRLTYLLCMLAVAGYGQSQPDTSSVWTGMIELSQSAGKRYVLNDLPGSICVCVPTKGEIKAFILGEKVLKTNSALPKLDATTPVTLISDSLRTDILAIN